LSVEDLVTKAIEDSASPPDFARPRRRLTVEQMLAAGDEIAALPLLDRRNPQQIMDDMNSI
jgi:antitoxin VapB